MLYIYIKEHDKIAYSYTYTYTHIADELRISTVDCAKVIFLLLILYSSCVGEGNGTPLQYSCLENPMDGGAW